MIAGSVTISDAGVVTKSGLAGTIYDALEAAEASTIPDPTPPADSTAEHRATYTAYMARVTLEIRRAWARRSNGLANVLAPYTGVTSGDVQTIVDGGTLNDVALGATTGLLVFTSNDVTEVTGLTGGATGRRLLMLAEGTWGFTFAHENVNSDPANRYSGVGGVGTAVIYTAIIDVVYYNNRWHQVSRSW